MGMQDRDYFQEDQVRRNNLPHVGHSKSRLKVKRKSKIYYLIALAVFGFGGLALVYWGSPFISDWISSIAFDLK